MSREVTSSSVESTDRRVEALALSLVRVPRVHLVVRRLLAALGVAVVVGLTVVPWQQSASGTGRVIAFAPTERLQNVEAPIEGRIVRWLVHEGSEVKSGDLIVEISDNDPQILLRLRDERDAVLSRLEAARTRATSLESRAGQLTSSRESATTAAAQRVKMARDRVAAAEKLEEAAAAGLATAKANARRQNELVQQGLTSTRAVELADLELVRARTETERARVAASAARSEESALAADSLKVGTDGSAAIDDARASRAAALTEVASASAELARIEVRLSRQTTQSVTAPRDGTILRVIAGGQGGDMVKAGDALAVLIPATAERAVELWVDGNDVPLLEADRHVRIQFEGWPAVQWVGWPSVAVGTFGGRVALIDAHDNGQGKFRVLVVPDGHEPWPSSRYLRQGVRANGWVLLQQVRLGYEVWRRFNGFPPLIAPTEPGASGKAKEGAK
ncbi:MAG: biotin/lipoyl-binding protein [Deltaproteobacteria bacterium]|nr:biotin/lipoyl-binding protein [Deltaproteobacteria bacterium]